ncbi:hypothetical protein DPMN_023533 [Dreissena polymorpha]|uniref:Uncharacterized protein n=1 Tax=Dreissena polymorpha TaxID=45954 RepID=A0A9D4RAT1_DREPO|nr:hypothetical protein DPMN_023533 [Dreissena polymorpha]
MWPLVFTRKTAPSICGHVFQWTGTTFELNQHIIKTNILKSYMKIGHKMFFFHESFHEDRTRNVASKVFTRKTAPPTGGHTNILTNSELNQGIIGKNLLSKKTAPPTGGHVFQQTGTTFKLNQHIIKTNILTNVYKFHEDRTKKCVFKPNVDDGRTDRQQTKTDHKSSAEQSGELKR